MTLLDADIKPDSVLGEDTWELFEAIECSFGIDLGDYRSHCGRTIRDLAASKAITPESKWRAPEIP
jgi:hypothetical protein